MSTLTRRLGLATTIALLAAAPAASADTYNATFGAGQENAFAWDGEVTGGPSAGIGGVPVVGGASWSNGCFDGFSVEGNQLPGFRCDHIVFDVKDAGEVEATTTIDEAPQCAPQDFACTRDIDIFLYKSDAKGERDTEAEPIAQSATVAQVETFKAKLKPGYYVLEVESYNGVDTTYKGTSTFTPDAAPVDTTPVVTPVVETPAPEASTEATPAPAPAVAPAPAPAAQPAPATAPAKTGKRAACQKKAKKIKKAKKRKKALKACSKKPV